MKLTLFPTTSWSMATCNAKAKPTAPRKPPQIITIASFHGRPYPKRVRNGLNRIMTSALRQRNVSYH